MNTTDPNASPVDTAPEDDVHKFDLPVSICTMRGMKTDEDTEFTSTIQSGEHAGE